VAVVKPGCPLVVAGFMALALALPGVARTYTLDQLLAQPLERLLELKITSRHVAQSALPRSSTPADRAAGGDHAP
jgi:hypothetical protein